MSNYVTIYHPEVGESKVHKESVEAWVRKGWSTEKPAEQPVEKTDLSQVEESEYKTDTEA